MLNILLKEPLVQISLKADRPLVVNHQKLSPIITSVVCQKKKLGLVEPLSELFKDEVRKLENLGLDHSILKKHPFPGPGLAINCRQIYRKNKDIAKC